MYSKFHNQKSQTSGQGFDLPQDTVQKTSQSQELQGQKKKTTLHLQSLTCNQDVESNGRPATSAVPEVCYGMVSLEFSQISRTLTPT